MKARVSASANTRPPHHHRPQRRSLPRARIRNPGPHAQRHLRRLRRGRATRPRPHLVARRRGRRRGALPGAARPFPQPADLRGPVAGRRKAAARMPPARTAGPNLRPRRLRRCLPRSRRRPAASSQPDGIGRPGRPGRGGLGGQRAQTRRHPRRRPASPRSPRPGTIREVAIEQNFRADSQRLAEGAYGIPVVGEYDVVVVGGGTGGAPAAIAAGRQGARTLLLEYLHGLGGVGTMGYIASYYHGNRVGFPPKWTKASRPTARRSAKEAGTRSTRANGSARAPPGRRGCLVRRPRPGRRHGRPAGHRRASCSPRTAAASSWPKPSSTPPATPTSPPPPAPPAATPTPPMSPSRAPASPRELGQKYTNTDYTFVDDTDVFDIWRVLVTARMKFHGAYDLGQLIDTRERRQIVGDFFFSPMDMVLRAHLPDTIVIARSNFDTHGYVIHPLFMIRPPHREDIEVRVSLALPAAPRPRRHDRHRPRRQRPPRRPALHPHAGRHPEPGLRRRRRRRHDLEERLRHPRDSTSGNCRSTSSPSATCPQASSARPTTSRCPRNASPTPSAGWSTTTTASRSCSPSLTLRSRCSAKPWLPRLRKTGWSTRTSWA